MGPLSPRFLTILFMITFTLFSFPPFLTAADGEILVGTVLPMTGPIATYGQESMNGIELALEKINEAGVKGKKIKLIQEDNKGEPIESANAVRKLVDIDKVVAIIGSVASSNTLAAAPIAQQGKTPLLTPASTNEKVTEQGDFIGRICFTDNFQGVVMAKFAFDSLKKKKAAVIIDNASDYSKGLAEVFKKKFKELGGTIVDRDFAYQQKDQDFLSLLRKVKRTRPDVIFVPGYYSEVGLILAQARQMGIDLPILGGDGWDSPTLQKLAGKGVKNSFISSHFSADDKDQSVQDFVKKYKAKYNSNPGAMAALGYDSMMVLANAISRSKSADPSDVKMAINSTKEFKGITGSITLDKNRNAIKSAVVLEITPEGNRFREKVNP